MKQISNATTVQDQWEQNNNLLLKDIDIQEICKNMYVHVHVACNK